MLPVILHDTVNGPMNYFKSRWIYLLPLILFSCSSPNVEPPSPVYPVPDLAQLSWHRMERNAFVHFTINTFTNKEWGYGDEKESLFDPSALSTTQWSATLAAAGFKGVILTCKHHDGFCLWPSEFTSHSIKNSPWKKGHGDLVGDLSRSVRDHGMKFGIYVSPWDRDRADYGTPAYVEVYRQQLKELFTNYGPFFEMWFDGANGGDGFYGGARDVRKINGATYYDWQTTLKQVRTLQSDVIFFSDAGPGVRWVGNERGEAGEANWNSITPDTLYAGKAGIENLLNSGNENGTRWIPAEVDVSIRPGWFYHPEEDSLLKTPERLFEIYLTSVGRGSTLLLNVPPDRTGRIHATDSVVLRKWNALITESFKVNFALQKPITSDKFRGRSDTYSPTHLNDGDTGTYWATDDAERTAAIEIDLEKNTPVKFVVVQEYIRLGQRVKSFTIEGYDNDKHMWEKIGQGTTIGYKRIIKLNNIKASKIRINITDARACPVISEIGVY